VAEKTLTHEEFEFLKGKIGLQAILASLAAREEESKRSEPSQEAEAAFGASAVVAPPMLTGTTEAVRVMS